MKGNEGKVVNIGTGHINNSKCEKLFGIKIDCKLSFDGHIGNIYAKRLVQN